MNVFHGRFSSNFLCKFTHTRALPVEWFGYFGSEDPLKKLEERTFSLGFIKCGLTQQICRICLKHFHVSWNVVTLHWRVRKCQTMPTPEAIKQLQFSNCTKNLENSQPQKRHGQNRMCPQLFSCNMLSEQPGASGPNSQSRDLLPFPKGNEAAQPVQIFNLGYSIPTDFFQRGVDPKSAFLRN